MAAGRCAAVALAFTVAAAHVDAQQPTPAGRVLKVEDYLHYGTVAGPQITKGIGVGVQSAPHQPPDVVKITPGTPAEVTQLTRVNEDLLTGVTLGDVEEMEYTSSGGTKVQGWLIKPPAFERSRKYPLILEIHGGPHSMYSVGFNFMFQLFAANGYAVLYTNPRGSTGYGSAFGNASEPIQAWTTTTCWPGWMPRSRKAASTAATCSSAGAAEAACFRAG